MKSLRDLSPAEIEFLVKLNKKLSKLEVALRREMFKIYKKLVKIINNQDFIEDFELSLNITYHLREDDPDFDINDDNIIIEQKSIEHLNKRSSQRGIHHLTIGDGDDHKEPLDWPVELKNVRHCWLFHDLCDHHHHQDIGWEEVLKIGELWVDFEILQQKNIAIKNNLLKNHKTA